MVDEPHQEDSWFHYSLLKDLQHYDVKYTNKLFHDIRKWPLCSIYDISKSYVYLHETCIYFVQSS